MKWHKHSPTKKNLHRHCISLSAMAGFSDDQSATAKKIWETINNVEFISTVDEIYEMGRSDKKEQQDMLAVKPWRKNNLHFFKDIKISAIALLRMVMHAHSGGPSEVSGLIHGKVSGNKLVIVGSFAVPKKFQSKVDVQAQAYEYMVAYNNTAVGHEDLFVGIYYSDHSLTGHFGNNISAQIMNQNFERPHIAIVIDPVRTAATGKVCLGAYPKGYKPPNQKSTGYQTVRLNKIEDFGVLNKEYYPFKGITNIKAMTML